MFTLKSTVSASHTNADDVAVVTHALRALGHYTQADRFLDPMADGAFFDAIKKFQTAEGLPATGQIARMDPTHRRMKQKLMSDAGRGGKFSAYRGAYEHHQDLAAWGEGPEGAEDKGES
jgi:hypothetical protein